MKIGIICSEGGHLIEALNVIEAFEGSDIFLITYNASHVGSVIQGKLDRVYKISYSVSNLMLFFKLVLNTFKMYRIFRKEKPDVLFSTGSEIAIPAFIIGKVLFGTKLIFLETIAKFNKPSGTGKMLFGISDKFIVPWKSLKKTYGDKAEFYGELI